MTAKAIRAGIDDARVWMTENEPSLWKLAIEPGTLGADEALINALGYEAAAKLLGVTYNSADDDEAFLSACEAYSTAWADTVRGAVAEQQRARDERIGL